MLTGENGGLFLAVSAKQKTMGLVLLGTVQNETLKEGEDVFFSDVLYDRIIRIEEQGEKINQAEPGKKVGICLKFTNRAELIKLLGLKIK